MPVLQDPSINIDTYIKNIKKKVGLFKYILFPEVSKADITNITRYEYFLLLLVPLISFLKIYKVILYTILSKTLRLDNLLN